MTPRVRQRVARRLAAGRLRLESARTACTAAKARPARRQLRKVGGRLGKVLGGLRRRAAGGTETRTADAMRSTTAVLLVDTRALARELVCP
jgi:hypothetical protein